MYGETDEHTKVFKKPPEEALFSGESGRLRSKRTWVQFQLRPNGFSSLFGHRRWETYFDPTMINCVILHIHVDKKIIPSRAIQRQNEVKEVKNFL